MKYSLPKSGKVSLKVYDIIGNLVMTLADGNLNAGVYNAEFDGSNLSSGIYFYTLEAEGFKETKKLSLIK
jgi:flagellar hook assembly protein FlgD